jgi:hypothetical protein
MGSKHAGARHKEHAPVVDHDGERVSGLQTVWQINFQHSIFEHDGNGLGEQPPVKEDEQPAQE